MVDLHGGSIVAQSAGSLARILGPLFSATLYGYRPMLPYLICGGVALLTGGFAWNFLCGKDVSSDVGKNIPMADGEDL